MKKIFTLLYIIICSFTLQQSAFSQCNYTSGGNGSSTSITNPINMDGIMSDWASYLNDPDNNSYDNTLGIDLDAPIADAGRDLVRFTFTEDASNLYIFLERAGSTANAVDIVFYVDINNNDIMDYREPVYHINWSGSNGNVSVAVKDYNPSILGILQNTLSLNLDGAKLMGTLSQRGNSGPGSSSGKGSADGKSVEVKIPFTQITQLNSSGEVINQLNFGNDFRFHVSTINGDVASVPGVNSINDNFGGCLRAPAASGVLPVHLVSFQGNMNKNNKVSLQWKVADNQTASHFEVQRSSNGRDFTTIGVVFASEKTDVENYMFYETVNSTDKVMYRLIMIDKQQDASYSKILVFQNKSTSNANLIKIFSNPVNDKLTFSYTSSITQPVDVKIYDMSGRIQLNQKITSYEGSNMVSLPLSSTFKSGFYVVEVNDGTEPQMAKFIKL